MPAGRAGSQEERGFVVAKAPPKKAAARAKSSRPARATTKTKGPKPAPKTIAKAGGGTNAEARKVRAGGGNGPRTASATELGRPGPNHGGPIGPPVASNEKPRKNQAGLTSRELEHFRDLLLAKRREILGDMSSMEREALRSSGGSNLSTLPIHMADMGTDNYEQEFTLGLVETERKLLREINQALAKIQDGTYGLCEGTGKPIAKARLEVQPWARYSIEYAKQMERGGR